MSDGRVLIFTYDGSYDGLLSTVFDAFVLKRLPDNVVPFDEEEPALLPVHEVETSRAHAERVEYGIKQKLGMAAYKMVRRGFLYGEEGKEMAILRFLWLGFHSEPGVAGRIALPEVAPLFKMATAVTNEAVQLRGFVRFIDQKGALVSIIHPKHYVLPLLRSFFAARLPKEHFLIFDETHGAALIHTADRSAIVPLESLEQPETNEDRFYRDLWKTYYRHIAIAPRYNPTCRRTHMPKRFWADLPEMEDEGLPSYPDPALPDFSARQKSCFVFDSVVK